MAKRTGWSQQKHLNVSGAEAPSSRIAIGLLNLHWIAYRRRVIEAETFTLDVMVSSGDNAYS
jgi:hypothetical protein